MVLPDFLLSALTRLLHHVHVEEESVTLKKGDLPKGHTASLVFTKVEGYNLGFLTLTL